MHDPQPGAPDYLFAAPPPPGTVHEVADGVLWVRMPLPFVLDHINLWLLEDDGGWTVVDTGYMRPETCELWERLLAEVVGGRPVTRILVTHFHPDHVGLAAWLCDRCGAPLAMTAGEFLMAWWVFSDGGLADFPVLDTFFHRHGLPRGRLAPLTARGNTYRHGVPALPHSYQRLQHGDRLTIGGRTWEVIVGHGHSPEHAALHCAADRLLISGDQVLPKITTNIGVWPSEPDDDPLGRYLRSFARFDTLHPETVVLPSHGGVFRGLHPRIAALRTHHGERLDRALDACAEPATAADLLPVLFRPELDLHQLRFAMGEAIAHLHFLWKDGRVAREAGADGVLRFRAC